MKYDTISFISDYGHKDEFVGVVKSVIRSIAPLVHVIDMTHEIEPFDVRSASLALVRSVHYMVPGVVLGVVDPNAGTAQRCIAVEVGDGESVLVGPDNGLFAPVVAVVGGATRAVEITNASYLLSGVGATFAGRDIYGPAAAHLCNGVDLAELGDEVDISVLQPAMIPFSDEENGILRADVMNVDRFGNAQLNVAAEQIQSWGEKVSVIIGEKKMSARIVRSFAELSDGEPGVIVDSTGLVSVILNQESAAERYGLHVDASLSLSAD